MYTYMYINKWVYELNLVQNMANFGLVSQRPLATSAGLVLLS